MQNTAEHDKAILDGFEAEIVEGRFPLYTDEIPGAAERLRQRVFAIMLEDTARSIADANLAAMDADTEEAENPDPVPREVGEEAAPESQ